jgi:hypothetical protein
MGHRFDQSQRVEGQVIGAWRSGLISLDLLPDFFFLLQLFFPELETDEKKIQERNPARKKKGQSRVDHPIPTSSRSMDEFSCVQS